MHRRYYSKALLQTIYGIVELLYLLPEVQQPLLATNFHCDFLEIYSFRGTNSRYKGSGTNDITILLSWFACDHHLCFIEKVIAPASNHYFNSGIKHATTRLWWACMISYCSDFSFELLLWVRLQSRYFCHLYNIFCFKKPIVLTKSIKS